LSHSQYIWSKRKARLYSLLVRYSLILDNQNVDFLGYLGRNNKKKLFHRRDFMYHRHL
jgi:hypothetical protein